MRKTLFISDLHLTEERPDISEAFFTFLSEQVDEYCDALYILGDFFEVWVGDDYQTPLTQKIAKQLKAITERQIPIYFVHGNRDFLVGKNYAKQAGLTLLPEQSVIDLYGTPTVILHGDEMCTQDHAYQAFRKKSRGWWWPKLMLSMPLWYRTKKAKQIREKSKQAQKDKPLDVLDVCPQAVVSMFKRYHVTHMIHGHTHRPANHQHEYHESERIVLGDWYHQNSYLSVTAESKHLYSKPF